MLVLLPMLLDYFHGCTRACSLGFAAKIKIRRIFVGIYMSMIWYLPCLLSEKYKIVSLNMKEFEDLQDLLASY
jgi:hypothetical protein